MQFSKAEIKGVGITSQRSRDAMVARLKQADIINSQVLNAMAYMPRHLFIEEGFNYQAYQDKSIPIKKGQTISQPFIVAKMTEELLNAKAKKVLEIGTGSGYQAAILAYLGMEVYSVERIEYLHKKALGVLSKLNIKTNLKLGDGHTGWIENAPFDAIIVTAAAPFLPSQLIEQLELNGVLIIPVEQNGKQFLYRYTKMPSELKQEILAEVKFVPLLSGIENE